MTTVSVPTFTASIYVGRKDRATRDLALKEDIYQKVQDYVDAVGLCVTLAETEFVYVKGSEPGFVVGLINYPRFPSSPEQSKAHALVIAEMLLKSCKQLKVTVVMPDETVMISAEDAL